MNHLLVLKVSGTYIAVDIYMGYMLKWEILFSLLGSPVLGVATYDSLFIIKSLRNVIFLRPQQIDYLVYGFFDKQVLGKYHIHYSPLLYCILSKIMFHY